MAIPITRDEFKDFCLRALGAPVLEINVDDSQVEDRIDKALYKYQQYHMDAVVKNYTKHQISASVFTFTGPATASFANGEIITGGTSNAHGIVVDTINSNSIHFYTTDGTFVDGDVVTGGASGAQGTVAANGIVLGDMDRKYIDIPDSIIAVTKIFAPFDSRISADILFDPTSQFNISLLSNFTASSIIPYVIGRQYQQLLNDTFRGRPPIRFQRHMNRLFVDVNWFTTFRPGQYLIIECFQTIDPSTYPDVWSDAWLQDYAIALIKKQWAQNMSKFQGIQLPGGVTLDAKSMLQEANDEIKDLDERLRNEFQLPVDFMVGGILMMLGLYGHTLLPIVNHLFA